MLSLLEPILLVSDIWVTETEPRPAVFYRQRQALDMPPPRIELGLRVPETLVMSFSLRGQLRAISATLELVACGSPEGQTSRFGRSWALQVTRRAGTRGRMH